MRELMLWWLLFEVMGLVGLPLAFRLFSERADHGYGFSKLLALLVTSYVAWIAGHAGVPYGAALNAAIGLFVVGNGLLFFSQSKEILAWLGGDGRRAIAVHDGLWTAGLLFFAWQRSMAPEIIGAEKFMDFAFYNTLARTDVLPPQDPWMSGEIFNYYYFGYQMMANLARLTPFPTELSYNFCVATLGGLGFSHACAVGLMHTRRLGWAALSGVMMTLMGNFDGFLQYMQQGGFRNFDYWRSTRIVGGDATINEFPYFTIIHGDMHPHFIVLPVIIILWAILTDPNRKRPAPGAFESFGDLFYYLPIGFLLGSAVVISPWELPVGALTTLLLMQRELPFWPLVSFARIRIAVAAVLLVGFGWCLYYPFYSHFKAPGGGVGFKFATTNLSEFLIVFAALLAPPAAYFGYHAVRNSELKLSREVLHALMAAAVLVLLVAGLAASSTGFNLVFPLLVLLALGALLAAYRDADVEQRTISLLTLGAIAAVLACEIVFIRDAYGEKLYRMNTVFKLYFQAWILLALAAPWFLQRLLGNTVAPSFGRPAAGIAGLLIFASCAYPAGITNTRLGHRGGVRTLDGNEYMRREHPGDYAAVQWLRQNVEGMPVILEASGNPYSYYARFSSNVGIPTVMGWGNHEGLWRSHDSSVGARHNDVTRMYTAPTLAEIKPLLDKYNVKYILIGDLEKNDYPAAGLAKFAELKLVFEQGSAKIYAR